MDFLFGKKLKPEELVKKWRTTIRGEGREVDRSIRAIELEELKVKKAIKLAAKKGETTNCKTLARELIRSRKAKDRLHTSKAQMNSVIMALEQQLATQKVIGHLQKSGEIMKHVNSLIKLPEISHTMQEMSREMMKAGIIEEMIDDTIGAADEDDIEEAAEEEVSKVLFELTDGLLGQAGKVGADLSEEDVAAEKAAEQMIQQLEALKQ